ncbi:MAG TPA: 2-amino-4-hydroxy-6-hydroxymethyldihydropteridine diphosphokinase, partial [Campylobacteraceae bacterium]|nr:2-amino-4-hydroxy-6-hydroxymethyldihydropteridine diphosphokinase [Campylobacteraceae bacterium]
MRKRLSADLTLYFSPAYPWQSSKKSSKKHTAILGIGGNVGNTPARFVRLLHYLRAHTLVDVVETSP